MIGLGIDSGSQAAPLRKKQVISFSDRLPVSISQLKEYVEYPVSSTAKDPEFTRMIKVAAMAVEREIDKTIVQKQYLAEYGPGDYIDLYFGPVISIDSVQQDNEDITYSGSIDKIYVSTKFWISNYGTPVNAFVKYTAGFLRPVTVDGSNTFTLTAHGLTDGDTVAFTGISELTEGTLYKIANATADTFTLTDMADQAVNVAATEEGFLGAIDPGYTEAILMQAAVNWLRGEASPGLSRKVKEFLWSLRDKAMY